MALSTMVEITPTPAIDDSMVVASSVLKRPFDGDIADDRDEETIKKQRIDCEGTNNGEMCGESGKQSSDLESVKSGQNINSTSSDGKSPNSSRANSPKPGTTSTPSNTKNPSQSIAESAGEDERSNNSDLNSAPKVPPLKIVMPQSTTAEQEQGNRNGKNISHQLPYVVGSSNGNESLDKEQSQSTTESKVESKKELNGDLEGVERSNHFARVLRSACKSVFAEKGLPMPKYNSNTFPFAPTTKSSLKRQQPPVPAVTSTTSSGPDAYPDFKFEACTNPIQQYMNIRKQIERKRKNLFAVKPKPPKGFKDYLLNRRTYTLASNTAEPVITAPPIVPACMADLYVSQEMARYKLRMQHIVEKEKLVLCAEQEILRVHGRAARALANQPYPFSVCTFLMDEEVYNLKTPEQEEKDRNTKVKFNGRLFLRSLQELDEKWEEIKVDMLRRQRNEAESLYACQRLFWKWDMRDVGLIGAYATPMPEDEHVSMIHVEDDFDLASA